jgi:molybdopterin synthase catalytic subunit
MTRFSISTKTLDVSGLTRFPTNPQAGAVVTFEGCVRTTNEGREVFSLEYEAYETLAMQEGERVAHEAMERFDVIEVRCIHRTGHLRIGELAVWVFVAAEHREAAFDACQYVINELKARLPIWKKEHFSDGESEWVNSPLSLFSGEQHNQKYGTTC